MNALPGGRSAYSFESSGKGPMIRVVIADDHEVVREGIKVALEDRSDMRVVGEAESGMELGRILDAGSCDVVLLDIGMPGVDGLDAVRGFMERYPKAAFLIVSMYPEKIYGIRTIKLGAAGYFQKTLPMTDLPLAVERAASGGRYISNKLAEELARGLMRENGDRKGYETLSNRELQVFQQLSQGLRISEIADLLNLSVKTVSTYKTRICEKLGLSGTGEIIIYAHTHKLLEEGEK